MIVQRASKRIGIPWRNGLGVQYEIVSDGSNPEDWTWRLSTADITRDVPFSSFPGVTREFCVADGNGVVLNINGVDHRCEQGSVTTFFGDDEVFATLIDGPMRALNLMRRDGAKGKSLRLSAGGQIIESCSVVVALHLPSTVIIGDDEISLHMLDALILDTQKTLRVSSGVVAAL